MAAYAIDDVVALAPARKHLRNQFGRVLQVGIDHHHGVGVGQVQAGGQGQFLAEVPRQPGAHHARIVRGQRSHHLPGVVAGAVVDVDHGAVQVQPVQNRRQAGMEGGQALAEALFGLLNPSGKLTISIPVHVGQQPVFYSQVRGQHGTRYADLTQEPLFPFGHGLSYTQYAYTNLRLASATLSPGGSVQVMVDVANVGTRAGIEIVQVYVSDVVTSATWVNKALKGFARVSLAPGEKKRVQVELPWAAFAIVNAQGVSVVEPGEFEILVGPSSRDGDLLKAKLVVEA